MNGDIARVMEGINRNKTNTIIMWGDGSKGICCSCDEEKVVCWSRDPYKYEINHKEEYGWWCEECYDTRSGDI